jgi:NADH:ubiquinone oxidoreductase subunit 2 (subunit N)
MLIAAMAKSVLFPLNTWIPEAMNAPTPVSALLHSACYVKAGVYLIARMYSLANWPHAWNVTVMTIGCVTILVGALFALAQTDMKRMLAYSTISQLGYIITGWALEPTSVLQPDYSIVSLMAFSKEHFSCVLAPFNTLLEQGIYAAWESGCTNAMDNTHLADRGCIHYRYSINKWFCGQMALA